MRKILVFSILFFLLTSGVAIALEVSNEARLEYNKGIDYYKLGQYERAGKAFRRAIDISPDYVDAYYNLGSLLEYLEQNEGALNVFRQIIVRCPEDYESVYKAAMLAEKLGNYQEAKNYIAIIPKTSDQYELALALARKIRISPTQSPKTSSQNNTVKDLTTKLFENISSPTGMVTDSSGNLFVAGFSNNTITKITPDGTRIIFIKNNKINGPIGMAKDTIGNIYVANYNANNVIKISKEGSTSILISNVKKPYGLYLDGNFLYISAQGTNSVLKYKLNQ